MRKREADIVIIDAEESKGQKQIVDPATVAHSVFAA
jgi:hypothetical protein